MENGSSGGDNIVLERRFHSIACDCSDDACVSCHFSNAVVACVCDKDVPRFVDCYVIRKIQQCCCRAYVVLHKPHFTCPG